MRNRLSLKYCRNRAELLELVFEGLLLLGLIRVIPREGRWAALQKTGRITICLWKRLAATWSTTWSPIVPS